MISSKVSALVGLLLLSSAMTDACDCEDRASLLGRCMDLDDAIDEARSGDVVYVQGRLKVKKEIKIKRDIFIAGLLCDGDKAEIDSEVDKDKGAVFHIDADDDEISVSISNIDFERTDGRARLVRTDEYYDDDDEVANDNRFTSGPMVNLEVRDCKIKKFRTKSRGGSAIFLQRVKRVSLANTEFTENKVERRKELYGGGGAVWLHEVPFGSNIYVDGCSFIENIHDFQHGLGGAFMAAYVLGDITITNNNQFIKNSASSGGAVHIARQNDTSTVNVGGFYDGNIAKEYGWGSRGSAIRLKQADGKINIAGRYINNVAKEGRGVISNNRIRGKTSVLISGEFWNNNCGSGGAIWDTNNEANPRSFIIDQSIFIQDNYSGDSTKDAFRFVLGDGTNDKKFVSEEKVQNANGDIVVF